MISILQGFIQTELKSASKHLNFNFKLKFYPGFLFGKFIGHFIVANLYAFCCSYDFELKH